MANDNPHMKTQGVIGGDNHSVMVNSPCSRLVFSLM